MWGEQMKARLNRQLFTQRVFDSGSLGVLASVAHPVPAAGRYPVRVLWNDEPIGTFAFQVSDAGEATQLTIDLAEFSTRRDSRGLDEYTLPVLGTKGHIFFHTSSGAGGYSVQIGAPDGKDGIEFDSRRLSEGDLFVLTLLEPTRYSMTDRAGGAKGEITVTFAREDAKRLASLDTVFVQSRGRVFEPAAVKLVATQGLVFRAGKGSRIVVEKLEDAPNPPDREPRIRWRKLRPTKRGQD
jgi:hypothetical protein